MTYFCAIKANILTMPRESWAWEFFARKDDDRTVAVCKECNKHIKCPGGTTSGLSRHLENIHKVKNPNKKECVESESRSEGRRGEKRQLNEKDGESMVKDIAKLIALDGCTTH